MLWCQQWVSLALCLLLNREQIRGCPCPAAWLTGGRIQWQRLLLPHLPFTHPLFLYSFSAPFHSFSTSTLPCQALPEHQQAMPPKLRCCTEWRSHNAGRSYSPGAINVLYSTFTTPEASCTHLQLAIRAKELSSLTSKRGPIISAVMPPCFLQNVWNASR